MWVADEEGEMEFLEHRGRNDGWIVGFGVCIVRIGCLGFIVFFAADVGLAVAVSVSIDLYVAVGLAIRGSIWQAVGLSTDALLLAAERGRDAWCFAIWRNQIVNDIFNEDSLALLEGEYDSECEVCTYRR